MDSHYPHSLCICFNSKKYIKTLASYFPEKASSVVVPETSITASAIRELTWFSECSPPKNVCSPKNVVSGMLNCTIIVQFLLFSPLSFAFSLFFFFPFSRNYLLNLSPVKIFSNTLRFTFFPRKMTH